MKVKMGMFMTDAVGKVGGQCLQRNHYGLFARNIVIPTNPQSDPQQNRRAALEFLTFNWRNLTDVQRAAWIAETAEYPRTNSFGDTYFMTGQALYIGLNLNLWRIGQPYIDSPVTKVIPPDFGIFLLNVDATGERFSISPEEPESDGDTMFIVYATNGMSPGRYYVSTALRSLAAYELDGSATYDIDADYYNYPFAPNAGDKVFCKVLTINKNCGCPGIPFISSAIAT